MLVSDLPANLSAGYSGLVNTIIALFKDTSLVIIIGLFDLFSSVQQATGTPWLGMSTRKDMFSLLIYWIFCLAYRVTANIWKNVLTPGVHGRREGVGVWS